MHNAVVCLLLTFAQPDYEQWQTPYTPLPIPLLLLFTVTSYGMEYPTGQLGSSVPSQLLVHSPSFFTGRTAMRN